MGKIDLKSPALLGPPPRKARFRRAVRNLRRAYRTMFMLIILVFGGWAVLEAIRLWDAPTPFEWQDNPSTRGYSLFMMISCGLAALLALAVFLWSERGLRRDLNLARYGLLTQGQIQTTGKGRRKRARAWITYSFIAANGATVQGRCIVPRNTPVEARAVGTSIDVLYDPDTPTINKARMGLDFIEFI
jgi:hypothetical protein